MASKQYSLWEYESHYLQTTEGIVPGSTGRESGETSSASSSFGEDSPDGAFTLQSVGQDVYGDTKKRDSKELNYRAENDLHRKCRRERIPGPQPESALTNAIKNICNDGVSSRGPKAVGVGGGANIVFGSSFDQFVDVEEDAIPTGTSQEYAQGTDFNSLRTQVYDSSAGSREPSSKIANGEGMAAKIFEAATTKWNTAALEKRNRLSTAETLQNQFMGTIKARNEVVFDASNQVMRNLQDGTKTVPLETTPPRKRSANTRRGSPCVRVENIVGSQKESSDELSVKVHGSKYVKARRAVDKKRDNRDDNGRDGSKPRSAVDGSVEQEKGVLRLSPTASSMSEVPLPEGVDEGPVVMGRKRLPGALIAPFQPISAPEQRCGIALDAPEEPPSSVVSSVLASPRRPSGQDPFTREESMIFDLELS